MCAEFLREMQETRLDAAMERQAERATTTAAWRDARQAIGDWSMVETYVLGSIILLRWHVGTLFMIRSSRPIYACLSDGGVLSI